MRLPPLAHPVWRFAAASLSPALFLVLGALAGGGWALFGLLWITLLLAIADRVGRRARAGGTQFAADPWTARLAIGIGALHFPLLAFAIYALSGRTGLGPGGWIAAFLGVGLWFGQVANPVAHELIHRSARLPFRLGTWVYVSMLYGHHTSAHRLVHHRFAATPDDPNSAAAGEGFYAFLARAWPGEFRAGYEMERALRQGTGQNWRNPYLIYMGGGLAFAVAIGGLFGAVGLMVWLLLCAHAQVQLLLADYVQHYGLERHRTGPDEYEPFGPSHSWDAPDPVSALMMLHAPRHADHHLHPARPYAALELSPRGRAPLLPWSLPVMATVALVPPLWHRIMDHRLHVPRRAR